MILKECKALAMNHFLKFHKLVHPLTNLPVSSDVKGAQFTIKNNECVRCFVGVGALLGFLRKHNATRNFTISP